MRMVRNPFAIKNEKTIMIADLSLDSRGLRCDCSCPNCKAPFIARMGDKNEHHFAHSAEACDEVKAYMVSIYTFLEENIEKRKTITLPPLAIKYNIFCWEKITEDNVANHVQIIDTCSGADNEIILYEPFEINIEKVFTCKDKKDNIVALEVMSKGKYFAIKIIPPKTICKMPHVIKHNEMPTIELNFTNYEITLNSLTSSEFEMLLIDSYNNKRWVYNPKIEKAFPEIIVKSEEIYENYMMEQKELELKRKEFNNFHIENRIYNYAFNTLHNFAHEKHAQIDKQEIYQKGYDEIIGLFDNCSESQIRDSYGNRWLKCNICGKIKIDNDMSIYGGAGHINDGICSICSKKEKQM